MWAGRNLKSSVTHSRAACVPLQPETAVQSIVQPCFSSGRPTVVTLASSSLTASWLSGPTYRQLQAVIAETNWLWVGVGIHRPTLQHLMTYKCDALDFMGKKKKNVWSGGKKKNQFDSISACKKKLNLAQSRFHRLHFVTPALILEPYHYFSTTLVINHSALWFDYRS